MAVRVSNFSVSLDGYGAGPKQDLDDPLGVDGERLHDWFVATRTFKQLYGEEGGTEGIDDRFAAAGRQGIGATIMGRNMFGPIRGEWGDENWTGWWGEDPPYHHDVFVLTHHPREPVNMAGDTTFYFVTDGIENALERAIKSAGDLDVLIGGGASTIQQYLRVGLIDELHLAFAPVLLGDGERLFDNLGDQPVGYQCTELAASDAALHVRLAKVAG